ncbi:hypothetical protein ACR34G_00630 [Mycoplasma sp. 480]|uniref:hypothetical protein n=1 Tax=Mycoplasma sp. 480 TaxID=3440155 RepID=UPI003F515169
MYINNKNYLFWNYFTNLKLSKEIYLFPFFGSYVFMWLFKNIVFLNLNDSDLEIDIKRKIYFILFFPLFISFVFLFVFLMCSVFLLQEWNNNPETSFYLKFLVATSGIIIYILLHPLWVFLAFRECKKYSHKEYNTKEKIDYSLFQIKNQKKWISFVLSKNHIDDFSCLKHFQFMIKNETNNKIKLTEKQNINISNNLVENIIFNWYKKHFYKFKLMFLLVYIKNIIKNQEQNDLNNNALYKYINKEIFFLIGLKLLFFTAWISSLILIIFLSNIFVFFIFLFCSILSYLVILKPFFGFIFRIKLLKKLQA